MDKDCIFCQIIAGQRAAEFVYQGESMVAFNDIYPHAPVHLLIVPRKHIRSINDLTEEDAGIVRDMIMKARDLAKEVGVARSGYKLVFNVERGAGQIIFHIHLHLMGGWTR